MAGAEFFMQWINFQKSKMQAGKMAQHGCTTQARSFAFHLQNPPEGGRKGLTPQSWYAHKTLSHTAQTCRQRIEDAEKASRQAGTHNNNNNNNNIIFQNNQGCNALSRKARTNWAACPHCQRCWRRCFKRGQVRSMEMWIWTGMRNTGKAGYGDG